MWTRPETNDLLLLLGINWRKNRERGEQFNGYISRYHDSYIIMDDSADGYTRRASHLRNYYSQDVSKIATGQSPMAAVGV